MGGGATDSVSLPVPPFGGKMTSCIKSLTIVAIAVVLATTCIIITSDSVDSADSEVYFSYQYPEGTGATLAYRVTGEGTVEATDSSNIVGLSSYSGDIVVPDRVKDGDGNEYTVVGIGYEFTITSYSNISSVSMPDNSPSFTYIGDFAFDGVSCDFKIPSSVTEIGQGAFSGCSAMTNIEIPDTVSKIDGSAFSGCSALTSLSLPAECQVDSGAFTGSGLKEVTIGDESFPITDDGQIGEYVAAIGDEKYETLAAAIADVPTDNTKTEITLLSNIDLDSTLLVPRNTNIVLDLKGFSISADSYMQQMISNNGVLCIIGEGSITASGTYPNDVERAILNTANGVLYLDGGVRISGGSYYTLDLVGNAVIRDVTIENNNEGSTFHIPVQILSSSSGSYSVVIDGATITSLGTTAAIENRGNLTVESGNISSNSIAILSSVSNSSPSSVVINGGSISGDSCAVQCTGGTLEISGGELTSDIGKECVSNGNVDIAEITIYGGQFTSDVSDFCEEGYISSGSDGVFEIVIDTENGYEAVAEIDGRQYISLQEAFSKASDGDEIVLLQTVRDVPSITIDDGRSITLNLKGNDVYFDFRNNFNVKHGGLSIIGEGTVSEQVTDEGNNFYFAPVMIYGSISDVADYTYVYIGSDVTLAGWSGLFIDYVRSGNGYYGYGIVIDFYGNIESELDYEGAGGHGIYLQGSITQSTGNVPEINVYEGSVINSAGNGMYLAGYAKTNITGGTITGETGLEIRAGELSISGNTTIISDADSYTIPGTPQGGGSTTSGAALSVAPYRSVEQGGEITISISGGNFSGPVAFSQINPDVDEGAGYDFEIINGTFTSTGKDSEGNAYPAIIADDVAGNFIQNGTFSSDITDHLEDGFVIKDNGDGTFGTRLDSEADITMNGENTPITSNNPTLTITSNGSYDASIAILFPDGTMTIAGSFEEGSYRIVFEEVSSTDDRFVTGFHIDTGNLIVSSLTVTVDISVPDGYRLIGASIYHQAEGSEIDADGFEPVRITSDGSLTFTTPSNSYYWVDASYEEIPYVPDRPVIIPDDDDYVPLPPNIVYEDSGDDDTVKIVACAAAAVVAALMVVVLIAEYRKR